MNPVQFHSNLKRVSTQKAFPFAHDYRPRTHTTNHVTFNTGLVATQIICPPNITPRQLLSASVSGAESHHSTSRFQARRKKKEKAL